MNRKIKFCIIIITLVFVQTNLFGQVNNGSERTIYLMRAKQFYGSLAKMDLMVNGELFQKIKNGNRLIIKSETNDTLKIQIVYPLITSHKSRVLEIPPGNESEIYVDLYYWGEGYNPLKHSGVIRGPIGSSPDFNIEIIELSKEEGEKKFNLSELYKDNNKIVEKRFP